MNKFLRSAALFTLGLFPLLAFAGTGDFQPNRSGYTYQSHPGGSSQIEFNRYKDSIPLAYFAGNCPDPVAVCQREYGKSSCTLAEFRSGLTQQEQNLCFNSNVSDERDFIKTGLLSGGSGHPYKDTLNQNLRAGDEVRFMVYVHNNGPEGKSAFLAKNTAVTVNWADKTNVKASIFASNAVPNTINDFTSLSFANNDLILEPKGNAFFLNHRTGNQLNAISPSSEGANSQTFTFGNFPSSYGNFHILYVDFKVVAGTRDATISKSSIPVTETLVQRNNNIEYKLTIENTGTLPLKNTIVRDPLDTNLTFVSAPETNKYTATHNNGLIQFNLKNDFLPGEIIDLIFTAKVNQDTPNNSIILNKGTLSADGIPDEVSNETRHPLDPDQGVLEITKEAFADYSDSPIPDDLTINDEFVYKITVRNNSVNNIMDVISWTDVLPVELDFVDQSPANNPQIINNNDILSATFGADGEINLAGNETRVFRFKVKIVAFPEDATTTSDLVKCTGIENGIVNEVSLSRDFELEDKECVVITFPPTLTSVKKAYDQNFNTEITSIGLDETFGYEIAVTNPSRTDAVADFVVTDAIPAELEFVGFAPTESDRGNNYTVTTSGPTAQNIVSFNFSNLKSFDTIRLRFLVKAIETPVNGQVDSLCPDPTNYNNIAAVIAYKTGLPQTEVNKLYQEALCHELPPEEGVLEITKEAFLDYSDTPITGDFDIDDEFVYKITVKNNSVNDILDVITWTDVLPIELDYVDQSPANTPQIVNNNESLSVTFGTDGEINLAGNETRVFRFKVRIVAFPEDSTTTTNPDECTGIENGILNEVTLNRSFSLIDEDEVCIPVNEAIISAEKEAYDAAFQSKISSIKLQEIFGYEIEVTNTQNTDITKDFVVTDILPVELDFVDFATHVSQGGFPLNVTNTQVDNRNLRFTFSGIKANDTVRLRFKVKAITQPTAGQTFTNVQGSPSSCPDPTFYNNGATVKMFNTGTTSQVGNDIDLCEPVSITTDDGGCTVNCGGGSTPSNVILGGCDITPNGSNVCRGINITDFCKDRRDGGLIESNEECRAAYLSLPENNSFQRCDRNGTQLQTDATCKPDEPLIPGGGTPLPVSVTPQIKKYVWDAKANKWDDLKTCVPQGEKTTYRVNVYVPSISLPGGIIASNAEVVMSDFVVPYSSGWTWQRNGITQVVASTTSGNKLNVSASEPKALGAGTITPINKLGEQYIASGGIRTSKSINPSGGVTVSFQYDLDTTLAVSSDICQLDNVAVARINVKAGGINYVRNSGGTTGEINLTDATLGDKARVCIARPFIKARGGSNVGVNFSSDKSKVFGSNFVEELQDIGSLSDPIQSISDMVNETITSGEFLKNNQSDSTYSGGSLVDFDGLDDYASGNGDNYKQQVFLNAQNNGTIFGKTGVKKSQVSEAYQFNSLTLNGYGGNINNGTTVFVNGNLTINSDLENNGSGFVAFIVSGDIIINKDVNKLDGIFFSQQQIKSTGVNGDAQLQINGGIMGDANPLLENRIFIGDNPTVKLEPAVLVRFDLRLLNDTPPGIEFFLGEAWREGIQ